MRRRLSQLLAQQVFVCLLTAICWYVIAAIISPSAAYADDCPGLFQRLFFNRSVNHQAIRTEYVDDNVAIIWFPTTDDTFTTTNIELDGGVWGTQMGFYRKGSTEAVERRERMNGVGHFRFALKVSNAELENLRRILSDPTSNKATCVEGACKALSKAGIQKIPFPANYTPTLNAIYSAINRAMPGTRVQKIDFVGKNPVKSVLGSKDFWSENSLVAGVAGAATFGVGMTGLIGYAIIDTMDPFGKLKRLVIPIFNGDDDK